MTAVSIGVYADGMDDVKGPAVGLRGVATDNFFTGLMGLGVCLEAGPVEDLRRLLCHVQAGIDLAMNKYVFVGFIPVQAILEKVPMRFRDNFTGCSMTVLFMGR